MFQNYDVILTRGGSRKSINLAAQHVFGADARFTHAAILFDEDIVLDSMPIDGVQLRSIYNELSLGHLKVSTNDYFDIQVLRSPVAHDIAKTVDVRKGLEIVRHTRKHYNWKFLLPNKSDQDQSSAESRAAFCSELIVIVLIQLGLLDNNVLVPSQTVPSQLSNLTRLGWIDVTEAFLDNIKQIHLLMNSSRNADRQLFLIKDFYATAKIQGLNNALAINDTFPENFDGLFTTTKKSIDYYKESESHIYQQKLISQQLLERLLEIQEELYRTNESR